MRVLGMTIFAIVSAFAARADFMSDFGVEHRLTPTTPSRIAMSDDFSNQLQTAFPPIADSELEDVLAAPRPQPRVSDSAAVLIFGLGGVGVWQAGRSAKKFASSIAPDWYHTGGPAQIGHSTPLPIDWTDSVGIDVAFEAPVVVVPHFCYRVPFEAAATLFESFQSRVLAPRAPPFASM